MSEMIQDPGGTRKWYLNGKFHREDGPAVEWADGTREWYLKGQRHREDGPAIERRDGVVEYCLRGQSVWVKTQEEFEEHLKYMIVREIQES